MKSLSTVLLTVVLTLGGCSSLQRSKPATVEQKAISEAVQKDHYSLDQTRKAVSFEAAIDRKIIRDANLTIEVASTTDAQQRVTSIAETYGGFVVTSEATQRENTEPAKRLVDIKLVIRVPSNQFNAALEQIEKLATNLPLRNVTGQDVTEEFIDLEARIRTQRALELQFLEIMKQANKVNDALEVQRQIADVRTEIEKLEGRKRFLESKSSMSTITVNIQTPTPIVVTASGFSHTVRDAISDSLDIATGIVLFFVRFVIVTLPIFVLVILPLGLVALYFRRRMKRFRLAAVLEANPISE
ncbi:MAG TPA: DUF4349 domain-containing protein [Pyrinomonadaceae bacterium]|nr:DUF4349 domain-containing protein [Pyrinomonadaceae bacterium]